MTKIGTPASHKTTSRNMKTSLMDDGNDAASMRAPLCA